MDNQKTIAQLLDNYKNNLILISITKNANEGFNPKNYEIQEKVLNYVKYQFSQKANYYSCFTFPDQEQLLYCNISSLCSKYKNKVIFAIFNEYFFGKKIMNKEEFNNMCIKLNKISEELPETYIIFFVNILIEEDNVNISEMKTYKNRIHIQEFIFCPTDNNIEYLEGKGFFSNSTYIIFNGLPLIKYSKASCSNELYNKNYKFGFGNMAILIDNELSKKISELVDIFICMDLTVRPYYNFINNADFSFTGDKDVLKDVEKLQNLLQKNQSGEAKNKKIIIIQSNSIEVSSNLINFKDGMILLQADPKTSFVTQINYNNYIKNILEQNENNYIKIKKYISSKHYQNYDEKKMHIFINEYNYFNFKNRLLSINSMAISNIIPSCDYYNYTDGLFKIQINAFSLENIQK